jgi:hypothetical protein
MGGFCELFHSAFSCSCISDRLRHVFPVFLQNRTLERLGLDGTIFLRLSSRRILDDSLHFRFFAIGLPSIFTLSGTVVQHGFLPNSNILPDVSGFSPR